METDATVPLQGERKFAALLFVDLSGYTELVRRLDPEEVARTIRPLLAELQGIVRESGGVVTTFAGDGFLAVFGVPTAVTDVAERALRAAEEIRAMIRSRRAGPGDSDIPDVHAGIAAGEILVVPSDEPIGWSLIGPPINLASRLCDVAAAGEILLDESCKVLVAAAAHELVPREVRLQGHDGVVRCWAVEAHATDGFTVGVAPTFVDRTDPLGRLDRALTETFETRVSRVYRIAGEPGIGKTRLVEHWLEQNPDWQSAWLRCADRTTDAALQLLDLSGFGQPNKAMRALLAMAGAGASGERRDDLFPLLLDGLRSQLLDAANGQRCVVVFEDIHAADPLVIDVLEDLERRPLGAPLLFVVTGRTDELTERWPADEVLASIPDDDMSVLLAAAFGAEPSPRLRTAILDRVSGHPLMALQSAAYLKEAGLVRMGDDSTCAPVTAETLEVLPTSLRLFVAARIDRLPRADKTVLQQLSTCGDPIDVDALQGMLGDDVEEKLAPLVARRLLVRDDSGVRFAHQLLREVAYASLPRAERARLHELQLRAAPPDRHALRAAHALGWEASISGTDREAATRAAASAIRETLGLAEHLYATRASSALSAARQVFDLLDDYAGHVPVEAAMLLTLTANALIDVGRVEEALTVAGRALGAANLAARDDLVVRALLARADAQSHLRRYHSARQVLDEAALLAERSGDEIGRGRALLLLGDTYRHSDTDMLLALTEQAHTTLMSAGDTHGAATCARVMAYWLSTSSNARFERWMREANSATPSTDLRGRLWLARAAAFAYGMRQDYVRATAEAAVCRELGEMVGTVNATIEGLIVGVEAATGLGDLDSARRLHQDAQAMADAQGNSRMRFMAAVVGAQPALRSGDGALAEAELKIVADGQDEFGGPERLDALVCMGSIARDRGSWQQAGRILTSAEEAAHAANFGLQALVVRARQLAAWIWSGRQVSPTAAKRLADDCLEAGATYVAAYVEAVAEQSAVLRGERVHPALADGSVPLEERGVRADTVALLAELDGDDARQRWRDAAQVWRELGHTVWLARAQARAGDRAAAQKTLDAIGAEAEGRSWALGNGSLQR